MKLRMHPQQHLHAGMEALPRNFLKLWARRLPHAAPTLGRSTSHKRVSVDVFLHKLHVAVAAALSDLRQLGLHPIVAGQGQLNGVTHKRVKLIKRQMAAITASAAIAKERSRASAHAEQRMLGPVVLSHIVCLY